MTASSLGLGFQGLKTRILGLLGEFMGFILLLSALLLLHLGQFSVKVMFETHFHNAAFSVAVTFVSKEAAVMFLCGVEQG